MCSYDHHMNLYRDSQDLRIPTFYKNTTNNLFNTQVALKCLTITVPRFLSYLEFRELSFLQKIEIIFLCSENARARIIY